MTAGAPPPPSVIREMESIGFDVLHVYGLTETYGHVTLNVWHDKWDDNETVNRDLMLARQGVAMSMLEEQDVVDSETMTPVPADGETIGEIVFRGNTIMKGYFKNPEATSEAFAGGYFHSGDLAVKHPDGYVQIKDRLKDIIISGGENISSVEVEATLHKHKSVALAAVVAMPDEKWGEVPCAFIELKDGATATEDELINFCREHMASFKRPKKVVFTDIPKTATGKMQKFELRRMINDGEIS
jgi:fatty-acyl-CoA synthase